MPLILQNRTQILIQGAITKAFFTAKLIKEAPGKACFVALQNPQSLRNFLNLLKVFLGPGTPIAAEGAIMWFEGKKEIARAWFLNRLASPSTDILFLPDKLLKQDLPDPTAYRKLTLSLETGAKIGQERVLELLKGWGYEMGFQTARPGQMAKRGGILDVFPPGEEGPLRFDWFGGTLDSIRQFDAETQRTITKLGRATLRPALIPTEAQGSFLSHLPAESVLVVENVENLVDNRDEAAKNPPPFDCFIGHVTAFGPVHRQEVLGISRTIRPRTKPLSSLGITAPNHTEGSLKGRLVEWVSALTSQGLRAVLLLRTQPQAERASYLLGQAKISCHIQPALFNGPSSLYVDQEKVIALVCPVEETGEVIEDEGLAFLTEQELFGKKRVQAAPKHRTDGLFSFKNLNVDEPLVHIEHGIGLYRGLKTLTVLGVEKEFIELIYAKGDKLFIPVEKSGVLMRYLGGNGQTLELATLGSKEFERATTKAKKRILEMAQDLIKVQAERDLAKKDPYIVEEALLREFESLFPYDETPDQSKAIEEVYKDLESERLMDRLICGDAGYGKTEVAMRAAFKTVLMGKQVAMLAPTTVLAYQHLQTFKDRFRSFPVHIEGLSRFSSPKAIRSAIRGISDGKVDIVIGTHRMLEKDVTFKNLGLLVIDEEQRFGVTHKERLKQLKTEVNILSLSATPIPRTLYMSLSGLKDLSILQTAPSERQLIETRLLPFSEGVIKEAIDKELQRKGQVFFVYNRIDELEKFAKFLSLRFPSAKIGVGHARMDEAELEAVMVDFFTGKLDILVSTSIVESGLDIPTANTMIVHRADLFGLSQLYQLKGRVGRSKQKGYFYLLVPQESALTKHAQDRMDAILAHDTMGSSFELAVRDLEVRGAGNILGREQSGVIQEIGLEMYFKLLKDTLENLSKKDSEKPFCSFEPELKLEAEALIPAHYMPEERDRLYHYRQIAMAPSEQTLERILEEMKDLYGDPPPKVLTLLELRRTGLLAQQLGVQKISQTKHELVFEVHHDYQSAFGEACLERLSMDKDVRFSKEGWIFLRRYPDVSGITQARRMLELWISWTNHKEACVS